MLPLFDLFTITLSNSIQIVSRSACYFYTHIVGHSRKRRALTTSHDTCPLILVADYKFYQNVGKHETSTTVNYLVRAILIMTFLLSI